MLIKDGLVIRDNPSKINDNLLLQKKAIQIISIKHNLNHCKLVICRVKFFLDSNSGTKLTHTCVILECEITRLRLGSLQQTWHVSGSSQNWTRLLLSAHLQEISGTNWDSDSLTTGLCWFGWVYTLTMLRYTRVWSESDWRKFTRLITTVNLCFLVYRLQTVVNLCLFKIKNKELSNYYFNRLTETLYSYLAAFLI